MTGINDLTYSIRRDQTIIHIQYRLVGIHKKSQRYKPSYYLRELILAHYSSQLNISLSSASGIQRITYENLISVLFQLYLLVTLIPEFLKSFIPHQNMKTNVQILSSSLPLLFSMRIRPRKTNGIQKFDFFL